MRRGRCRGRTTALDERRRSEMGPWQRHSWQAEVELCACHSAATEQGAWPAANNACSSPAAAAPVPAERILERWSQRERGDGVARSGGDVGLSTQCRRQARGMAPPAKANPAVLAFVGCG